MKVPTEKDLECLILWPDGTIGALKEKILLNCLLSMCKVFGFGRVPQLAKEIEDIWRNSENIELYEERRVAHLELLEDDKRKYEKTKERIRRGG